MKDIAALCRRVVIIAHGQIVYDGSLEGVIDRFGGRKLLTFQFSGDTMPDLEQYGEVVSVEPPKATLKVDRQEVPRVLSSILEEPPRGQPSSSMRTAS